MKIGGRTRPVRLLAYLTISILASAIVFFTTYEKGHTSWMSAAFGWLCLALILALIVSIAVIPCVKQRKEDKDQSQPPASPRTRSPDRRNEP